MSDEKEDFIEPAEGQFRCDGCSQIKYEEGSIKVGGYVYCEDCQTDNYEARWRIFISKHTNDFDAGLDLMEKYCALEIDLQDTKKEVVRLRDQMIKASEHCFDEGYNRGHKRGMEEYKRSLVLRGKKL